MGIQVIPGSPLSKIQGTPNNSSGGGQNGGIQVIPGSPLSKIQPVGNSSVQPINQSAPVSKPVNTPSTKNLQPSLIQDMQSVVGNVINDIKGIFTPKTGTPQFITAAPEVGNNAVKLTQPQVASIAKLQPGQTIPNFQSVAPEVGTVATTKKKTNLIDNFFQNPGSFSTASLNGNEFQKGQPLNSVASFVIGQIAKPLQESLPQTAQAVASVVSDPLNLKANIADLPKNIWNSIATSVNDYFNALRVSDQPAANVPQQLGRELMVLSSGANVVFSPISTLFKAADTVPVVGALTKAISLPFLYFGEGASDIAGSIINDLPFSPQVKSDLRPGFQAIATLATQLALGEGIDRAGVVEKFGDAANTIIDQATKMKTDIMVPGETTTISASQLLDIHKTGNLTTPEEKDLINTVFENNPEGYKNMIRQAAAGQDLEIKVPPQQLRVIEDKPYWANIKSFFGQKESPIDIRNLSGSEGITGGAAAPKQLTSGSIEFTPKQAQTAIIGSDMEDTPLGKEILKTSLKASQSGQNIRIDLQKGGEGQLKTPAGITATNIQIVPPTTGKTTSGTLASSSSGTQGETLYHGSNGVVTEAQKSYNNVIALHDNQAELIGHLAQAGNPEAKQMVEALNSGQRVDFGKADTVIYNALKGKADAIRYNNESLPQKGIEYHDLGENRFYSANRLTAEQYAKQARGLKHTQAVENVISDLGKLPQDDPNVKELQGIAQKLNQGTIVIEKDAQDILKRIYAAKDFSAFTNIVHNLSETYGGNWTKVYDKIQSGVINEQTYSLPQNNNQEGIRATEGKLNTEGSQSTEGLSGNPKSSQATVTEGNGTGRGSNLQQQPGQNNSENINSGAESGISNSTEGSNASTAGRNTEIKSESFNGTEIKNDFNTLGINPEAGFINPGSIIDDIRAQMEKARINDENATFGRLLRTYFTGQRDIRIAEINQSILGWEKLIKKPLEQDALSVYREFKNRTGELTELTAGTHAYYKNLTESFERHNPTANTKEIDQFRNSLFARVKRMSAVLNLAANPTDAMKTVDAQMSQFAQRWLTEGKELGFLDSTLDPQTFISHLFTPKDQVEIADKPNGMYAGKNKIGRYFQFARKRVYQDVIEGYMNGAEPKTLNAFHIFSIYGDKYATVAATKLLIKELKDTELGKWGSRNSKFIPSDWRPIAPESNLFRNEIPFITKVKSEALTESQIADWDRQVEKGTAEVTPEGYQRADIAHQSLFAPKKVVDALAPITDPDYMNKIPGFGKMRLYQAYLKSAELSLSVFHMRALNITAVNSMGVIGLTKSKLADMNSDTFLSNERAGIKAGLTTSVLGRAVEGYRATRQESFKLNRIPTRAELFKMVPGVKQIQSGARYLTYHTFDVLQRKMKVTDFAVKDAAWISKHPNATEAEHFKAQSDIARYVNATYGGIQWEIMGVNKATLSVARFFLLAPDWTFSNWLNLKGAAPSWLPGGLKGNGGEAGMAARAFWVRSIITGIIVNQLYSLLMSGQMSPNPAKAYLGKDSSGKEVYDNIGFAGAPQDLLTLLTNINDYGLIMGLTQTIASKGSPIVTRLGAEALTGRNYLGQQIVPKGSGAVVGTARAAFELGSNVNPIPFSFADWFKMLTDTTGKYIPAEYLSILLGGGTPSHVVPTGMRQVTSGARKGEIVPATPNAPARPLLEQITTGKLYEPKKR